MIFMIIAIALLIVGFSITLACVYNSYKKKLRAERNKNFDEVKASFDKEFDTITKDLRKLETEKEKKNFELEQIKKQYEEKKEYYAIELQKGREQLDQQKQQGKQELDDYVTLIAQNKKIEKEKFDEFVKQLKADQENKKLDLDKELATIQKELETLRANGIEDIEKDIAAQSKLRHEELKNKYQKEEFVLQEAHKAFLENLEQEKQQTCANITLQIEEYQAQLGIWQAAVRGENERQREKQGLDNKYALHHLILTDEQWERIKRLAQISDEYFQDEPDIQRAIHEVIWKKYLMKALDEMITRQFGKEEPENVIYHIEDENGSYIGKATNLKKRWRQHIRGSLGLEKGEDKENKKFYQALYKNWDRFEFRIQEYCEKSTLDEREHYWIDFFDATIYGYNMTK